MNQSELNEILEKHKLWIYGKEGGERAILRGANLEGANLVCANLEGADLTYADLSYANLEGADLTYADLSYADLRGADLRGADLTYADLEYSCFPLWCGGIGWKVDKNLPNMLAAFICSMECDDERVQEMQSKLAEYARDSHRFDDILSEKVSKRV